MNFCERCRSHSADVLVGSTCLCEPCAQTVAWEMGVPLQAIAAPVDSYVTSGITDVTPFGILVPPIGALELAGHGIHGSSSSRKQPDDGFPFVRVMLVLGGVAAVGVVGIMAVNAFKTANTARETIQKHPELLAALA